MGVPSNDLLQIQSWLRSQTYPEIQCVSTLYSSCFLTGFAMAQDIPTAKHFSLSVLEAFAVTAIIGHSSRLFWASKARISLVALKPSSPGIETSIKTKSNVSSPNILTACSPSLQNLRVAPVGSSNLRNTNWLVLLSSATKILGRTSM